MKKIVLLLLATLCLFACGGDSNSNGDATMVCSGESDSQMLVNSVYADGDVITRIVYYAEADGTMLGLDEETLQLLVDQVASEYGQYEFIDYNAEVKDGTVIETTDINFKDADMEALYNLSIVDRADADYISLELVRSAFEEMGLSCTNSK